MKKIKDYSKVIKKLKTERIKDSLGRTRAKITYAKKPKMYTGEQQKPQKIKKSKTYDITSEEDGIFVKSVKGQKPRYFLEKALFATEREFAKEYA
jgi:hypothetical protein